MQTVTTIGLDIAKAVFQVHGMVSRTGDGFLPAVPVSFVKRLGRLRIRLGTSRSDS
jgi:hypothetical protein